MDSIFWSLAGVAVVYTLVDGMTDSKTLATIAGIAAILYVFWDEFEITTTESTPVIEVMEESNPIENFIDDDCVKKYGEFACQQ